MLHLIFHICKVFLACKLANFFIEICSSAVNFFQTIDSMVKLLVNLRYKLKILVYFANFVFRLHVCRFYQNFRHVLGTQIVDWAFIDSINSKVSNVLYNVARSSLYFEQVFKLCHFFFRLFCTDCYLLELVVRPLLDLVKMFLDLMIFICSLFYRFLKQLDLHIELGIKSLLQVLHALLHKLDLVLHCLHEHHHTICICPIRYENFIVLFINVFFDAVMSAVKVTFAKASFIQKITVFVFVYVGPKSMC